MLTIEALKSRLNGNCLEVQKEDGYVANENFVFHDGAPISKLRMLPEYVPRDVIKLLEQHNGAELFVDSEYGGGIQLFSVDEILEYITMWSCPENFTPVGAGPDGEWIVCENSDDQKENYMWIGEFLSFDDEFDKLPIDFLKWLDFLIIAQGTQYWNWIRK